MAKMPDVQVKITIDAADFIKALDEAKRTLERNLIIINVSTTPPSS